MISVSVFIKNEFYDDFFEKRIKNGYCEESLYKDNYIYSRIDDDNKVKFNELKDFHFYNAELEYDFVFTYEDLFITYKNRRYFLITYKKSSVTILGKPFFRKYTMVFNPDNKQIGHYIKVENKNNENDNENDTKKIIPIIIIVILIIIIIILGIAIFKLFGRKKRKKNELDDDYDYIPEKNSIGVN